VPSFDRLSQGSVVAPLLALAIECTGLAVKVVRCLIRVSCRHKCCRLLEVLGGIDITQLCQRDVAAAGEKFRRIQSVAIFGFLDLLLELARLPKGGELALLGLVEQGASLGQPAAVERLFRRVSELGRVRIIRLECGQLVSGLREMGGDLD
jgi:hypothetical protein